MYISISEETERIDEILRKKDAKKRLKQEIILLESTEKIISKKHDFYKSISPVSIFSIIVSILAKVYPEYPQNDINSIINIIWIKISNLNISLNKLVCYFKFNKLGDLFLIILIVTLFICLIKTIDTLYKYKNIVNVTRRYKEALIILQESSN